MPAPKGNKFALGNKGGRPPAFESPEDMENEIQAYFDMQVENKGIITVAGLAYNLGFESRQSLQDYKQKEEFTYIIKRAVLFIENCYEEKLSGTTPTGAIFALKNMGWKDKIEQEINTNVHLTDEPIVFE